MSKSKPEFKQLSEEESLWDSAVRNGETEVQNVKRDLIFKTKVLEMSKKELEKAKSI